MEICECCIIISGSLTTFTSFANDFQEYFLNCYKTFDTVYCSPGLLNEGFSDFYDNLRKFLRNFLLFNVF